MKIEVWSDIACPFCYIGKRKLEEALDRFPHKDQVKIEFKSFELDSNAELYDGKSYYEKLSSKHGMRIGQAKHFSASIALQAKNIGLTFNFEELKSTNTFDAHRLIKFGMSHGKETTVIEKLFYAYFTEARDIGDLETLADIAEASGLERKETLEVLHDKTLYANDVRSDESDAKRYGITGVPYFIFNKKHTISGAQPTIAFVRTLQKVWEEENPWCQSLKQT
ncbi:DsbA family oxidoreductase [Sporosarcina ureilytica]|uniref:Disulfide bond formation protein DsbA n=1 Tax=Sporosarcina ureilytica TaxID=298596 RepID=A0A1D8JDD8_9BACL|nr:DsbA family oxidoreductase [Sporosarcina ureilytica]AOV06719.1 disulfide bond formation protein DsbA [Sporosarcina ureilytica]